MKKTIITKTKIELDKEEYEILSSALSILEDIDWAVNLNTPCDMDVFLDEDLKILAEGIKEHITNIEDWLDS